MGDLTGERGPCHRSTSFILRPKNIYSLEYDIPAEGIKWLLDNHQYKDRKVRTRHTSQYISNRTGSR